MIFNSSFCIKKSSQKIFCVGEILLCKANQMRNSLARAKNRERSTAFLARGETDFELIRYYEILTHFVDLRECFCKKKEIVCSIIR